LSVTINISGQVIDIPSSGQSPNWASGVIEAFQAIADALQSVAGPFDVPPQAQPLDSYNPGTDIELQNASFPTTEVRSVELIYSVFRQTTTDTVYEQGTLKAIYSPDNPVTQKWEVQRFGNNDAKIDFTFQDNGVVVFSTEAIPGTNHTGFLTFTAKALLQSS
jgi:hypothetical protein